MKSLLPRALALLAVLIPALPASAADRPAGWQTWSWEGSCFAIVYAEAGGSGPGASSERAYIAVKHVPKERTYDGVTVASGMDIPVGTEGLIEVNGQEYPLLVFKGAGFVRSGEPEKSLVDNLAKASEARVTWMLKDGLTIQTYKVGGFGSAHKVLDAGCPRAASEASAPDEAPKPAKAAGRRGGRG